MSVAASLTNIAASGLAQSDEIIAAYGVVQRLILIGCYVIMGFMQGYQPVASYAFGARDEDRFHQPVRFALKGSLLLTVMVAAVYILLSQPAADILTILVCLLSIKSMKRTASSNMGA